MISGGALGTVYSISSTLELQGMPNSFAVFPLILTCFERLDSTYTARGILAPNATPTGYNATFTFTGLYYSGYLYGRYNYSNGGNEWSSGYYTQIGSLYPTITPSSAVIIPISAGFVLTINGYGFGDNTQAASSIVITLSSGTCTPYAFNGNGVLKYIIPSLFSYLATKLIHVHT